jgi:putative SOS response-associated peptidase YedK
MCGRYLTPAEADFERGWKLHAPTAYRRSYNFAPSQTGPVLLRSDDGSLRLELLVWGYQPSWAERGWINARSETVFSSRAFAPGAKRHRCVVPALGWYEWQGKSAPRQPWLFHLDGFRPFAFAGIFCPAGADEKGNFAILTTEAAKDLAHIHGRMPVVLDDDDQQRWLDPALDQDKALQVIDRHRTGFSTYKVSPYVNKPANNDAQCLVPL